MPTQLLPAVLPWHLPASPASSALPAAERALNTRRNAAGLPGYQQEKGTPEPQPIPNFPAGWRAGVRSSGCGAGMCPVTNSPGIHRRDSASPAAHVCIPISHPLGAAPGLFPSGEQFPSLPLLELLQRINTKPEVFPACSSQRVI